MPSGLLSSTTRTSASGMLGAHRGEHAAGRSRARCRSGQDHDDAARQASRALSSATVGRPMAASRRGGTPAAPRVRRRPTSACGPGPARSAPSRCRSASSRQHGGQRRTEVGRARPARPVVPSTTEHRCPRMSVATAGVPQAAASVSDRPQPSASEALATTHARRYSSRSASRSTWPAARPSRPPPWSAIHRRRSARIGPVADQPQAQVGDAPRGLQRRLEQQLEALDRRQPADGDDERVRACAQPPGEKNVVDAVVDRRHHRGAEAELRAARRGSPPTASPSRCGGRTAGPAGLLEQPPGAGQRTGQDLVPHRAVDVVEDRDVRPAVPHRREPRHAVPDLDQRVRAAHAPEPARRPPCGGTRGSGSPGGPPRSRCARSSAGRPTAADVRCTMSRPGGGPAAHELVGVDLRAAGVGIVEVSPRQDVDPAHAVRPIARRPAPRSTAGIRRRRARPHATASEPVRPPVGPGRHRPRTTPAGEPRRLMPTFPPPAALIARFGDRARSRTTSPACRPSVGPRSSRSPAARIAAMPSPMRVGVGVVAVARRRRRRLASAAPCRRASSPAGPLPVLGEYVRLVRSLGLRLRVGDAGPTRRPTARRHE